MCIRDRLTVAEIAGVQAAKRTWEWIPLCHTILLTGIVVKACLLYTSDAADDLLCVDLGGRRIIKKKNTTITTQLTVSSYQRTLLSIIHVLLTQQ